MTYYWFSTALGRLLRVSVLLPSRRRCQCEPMFNRPHLFPQRCSLNYQPRCHFFSADYVTSSTFPQALLLVLEIRILIGVYRNSRKAAKPVLEVSYAI